MTGPASHRTLPPPDRVRVGHRTPPDRTPPPDRARVARRTPKDPARVGHRTPPVSARSARRALRYRPARTPARRDRGQVALEFAGFLPILMILALAALQLGVGAYTALQAGTAARAAARADSDDDPATTGGQAARAAVSGWLADDLVHSGGPGGREATATVRIRIPSVIPFVDWGHAERSSTMPAD
ncbi:TadE family protein [Streptomyces sp. NPDC005805]|uniref:TadE/TadG family type IV pilus assembly protein n=1 Tax=Streptomyces sp. NPDC005805 TaxID=3157068 RepID=UPI0033E6004B